MKTVVIEKQKNEKHYFDNEENAITFLKEHNISLSETEEILAEDEINSGDVYKLILIRMNEEFYNKLLETYPEKVLSIEKAYLKKGGDFKKDVIYHMDDSSMISIMSNNLTMMYYLDMYIVK